MDCSPHSTSHSPFVSNRFPVLIPKFTRAAFTLVELLAVMVIMILMVAAAVPAFNALSGASSNTKAAYEIAGALEQARAYAMANNTYVWVGFVEEDASKPTPSTPVAGTSDPGGRVIISIVASADGSRYSDSSVTASDPPAFGANLSPTSKNQTKLVQINKLIKLENVHLGSLNDGLANSSNNNPPRPPVAADYQVGDPAFAKHMSSSGGAPVSNPTTFKYPLSGNTAQYTFLKIVEFNPQGSASKIVDNIINGPQKWIEIGLQPTHGNAVDPLYKGTMKANAAVMIEGITGRVGIIRL